MGTVPLMEAGTLEPARVRSRPFIPGTAQIPASAGRTHVQQGPTPTAVARIAGRPTTEAVLRHCVLPVALPVAAAHPTVALQAAVAHPMVGAAAPSDKDR